MKRYLYVMFAMLLVTLASCSKEENGNPADSGTKSFTVNISDGVNTRAATPPATLPSRYVMEIYEGATAAGKPMIHKEQANGTFEGVFLKNGQTYVVAFWADYGTPNNNTSGAYNAADLKAAQVVAGKNPVNAAFAGASKFTVGTDNEETYTKVTLTHAVAQVNFRQTETLLSAANTLVVGYPESYSLNVADFSVTKINGKVEHTFTYNKQETGTIGTSYLIAATGSVKTVMDITATFNSEVAKEITAVPFERNFRTNISGAYSDIYNGALTVTCDDQWKPTGNEAVTVPAYVYTNDTEAKAPEGDGSGSTPYLIASAANIKWMQGLTSRESTESKFFKLTTDIEVIADSWQPIGSNGFYGYFEGNNHKFTGKLIAPAGFGESGFGIFGTLAGGFIRFITNEAEVFAPDVANVGGITGRITGAEGMPSVSYSRNIAKITGKYNVGGIIGSYHFANEERTTGDNELIYDCLNMGAITAREFNTEESNSSAGGIVGNVHLQPAANAKNEDVIYRLSKCRNKGNVSAPGGGRYAGGIAGCAGVVRGTLYVQGSTNSGTVKINNTGATENIGTGENKLGLFVGGRYKGYTGIVTVIN